MNIPTKALPSGAVMPGIGFGVYESAPGSETYDSVLEALRAGYRYIDTAGSYYNEEDVGKAVRDSGIPRDEIFVTSKVYLHRFSYEDVAGAIRESHRMLDIGFIDLYLLHAPGPSEGRADAWRALEDMQTEGLVRDIGVSNFGEGHLAKLAETWRVKPAVNQIELHPWMTRTSTVKYCQELGIALQAYSPLARAMKMGDPTLVRMASEVSATPAQVLIAWSLAKGFVPLPKSVKAARIKENLEAVAVELTTAQIEALDALDCYFVTAWDPIKEDPI
jgi:diketogulonate reductase-like aldo/keto reductase